MLDNTLPKLRLTALTTSFALKGFLTFRSKIAQVPVRTNASRATLPGALQKCAASFDRAADSPDESRIEDVIAIDGALERLAKKDPMQERIVELRFFAGLTVEEIAHVLGRSPRTVKREWQLAKAWLFRELHTEPAVV